MSVAEREAVGSRRDDQYYQAHWEALDRGRDTREDLAIVSKKLRTTPAAVTDDDLAVYWFWHGARHAEEARAQRELAHTTHDDARNIQQRLDASPATVTDHDLAVYGHWFGEQKAALARARLDAAFKAPRVQKQQKRIPASRKYAASDEWVAALKDAYARVHVKKEQPTARDRELLSEPVNYGEIAGVMKVLDTLSDFALDSNKKNAERNERIKILEKRIAELESSHAVLSEKALKGGAPWQRGVTYAVNDCVQHDGSLWKCVETHVSGASFSHEHFLLQIKRGRDGKDATR